MHFMTDRRQDIKGGHNLDDTQISACVLADVQQKQAQEVESILMEMQYKVRYLDITENFYNSAIFWDMINTTYLVVCEVSIP